MKKYFIVAGEPSGDLHGSKLIKAIKDLNPNSSFMGQIEAQIRIAIKKINLNDSQVIGLTLFPSLIILEKTGNNKPANK